MLRHVPASFFYQHGIGLAAAMDRRVTNVDCAQRLTPHVRRLFTVARCTADGSLAMTKYVLLRGGHVLSKTGSRLHAHINLKDAGPLVISYNREMPIQCRF